MADNFNSRSGPSRRQPLEWIVLLAYLLMVVAGVLLHEPWRDEWRAWMISALATGPADLLRMLAGEGHPWLWYLLLKPLTIWPGGQAGLALAGLATGLIFPVVFFLCCRLPLWIRTGVIFSVYWLAEYVVVSRSYGLAFGLTTLGIFTMVRTGRWLLAALLIGLAAHAHLLTALANLPLIALMAVWGRQRPVRHRALALVLALILSFTGIAAAIGPGALAYGQNRIASITARAARMIPGFPVLPPARPIRARQPGREANTPAVVEANAASASAADGDTQASPAARLGTLRRLIPVAGPALILVVFAGLWQRARTVVLVYSLPALAILLLFLRLIYSGGPWHQGTVFMVLVFTLLLAAEQPLLPGQPHSALWLDHPWLRALRRSGAAGRLSLLALSLLLLLGCAEGLHRWSLDIRQPFSGAPAAAAYIRAQGLTPEQILPRSSDMDEALTIALQPLARLPRPIADLRPHHLRKWTVPAPRICRLASEMAQRLDRPVFIVANGRDGSHTECADGRSRVITFPGQRESLEFVEIQP